MMRMTVQYLQQIAKQYCVAQRAVKLILSVDLMLGIVWSVTFSISIKTSVSSGYFTFSAVPKMKLHACKIRLRYKILYIANFKRKSLNER